MQLPPLLSQLIWIPIVAGLVVLRAGSDRALNRTRWIALIGALAGLAPVIPLVHGFENPLGDSLLLIYSKKNPGP